MRLKALILTVFVVCLCSCREYNKLLKSADLEKKYAEAVKFYEKGDCLRALQLFEELLTVYKGTPKAESIYYYYAYSNYCVGDYLLAAYHFRTFTRSYPTSKHTEECAFMAAQCYYYESPRYSLDQTDTKNAIRELQGFINRFPTSTRLDSCNKLIDKLRIKLEKKEMEISLQYYHMEDYKASISSFNNLLREFPDTKYRDRINYYIIKASYEQALRSIDEKKLTRLNDVLDLVMKYQAAFRDSGEYRTEVSLLGLSASDLKERSAWDIPYGYFEARKYSKAIEGFKEFRTLYPASAKAEKAKGLISDSYFLVVQLSYQNIEKSYGVNPVVNAYKEYTKNATKYNSLIDGKYASQLQSFSEQAAFLSIHRSFVQLEEAFRLQDISALTHFKTVLDFYLECGKLIASDKEKNELASHFEKLKKQKEFIEKEIGFWLYEKKNYERSRAVLQKYFPVTDRVELQSKAFYYFMRSLASTTTAISVLRPDFRKVYYDSLQKLHAVYTPLLTNAYKRKTEDLMREVLEEQDELPGEYIQQLFRIGQFNDVVKKTDELAGDVKNPEVKSRMLYYKARTGYDRSKFGYPSPAMLKTVQDAKAICLSVKDNMKGKYKRKTLKMLRKLKKRERSISKTLSHQAK